jgi:thiamine-phosphate pyrophosphorylase
VSGVPRLTLVTDRRATAGRPLTEVIAAALAGVGGSGVAPGEVAVQLREKDLPGRALTELARALRALTAAAGVALYVNDRLDVALAVGADGVHLGGGSLAAADLARVAPGLAIGASAHGPADVAALRAAADDARGAFAYVLLGPIRDTPSKRRFGPPLGEAALAAAATIGLPLIAIGGVTPNDVPALLAAGARGVACIRAVLGADDPGRVTREFCKQLSAAPPPSPHRAANT